MENETPAVVEDLAVRDGIDVNLVALTPAEMVPAQAGLVDWCDRKIRALTDEADELALHEKLATENGWKTSVVTANVNRTARRIVYYSKMRDALAAGYLLVPNMPVEIMAVRVNRAKQSESTSDSAWHGDFPAKPQASLPSGEGRYVNDTLLRHSRRYGDTDGAGKPIVRTQYFSGDYDEVDFPIALTKPVVLDAVARAMALKIFDQIGLVRNGSPKRDPIYVGQLLDPRGNDRMATFFLAWWVDTSTL